MNDNYENKYRLNSLTETVKLQTTVKAIELLT